MVGKNMSNPNNMEICKGCSEFPCKRDKCGVDDQCLRCSYFSTEEHDCAYDGSKIPLPACEEQSSINLDDIVPGSSYQFLKSMKKAMSVLAECKMNEDYNLLEFILKKY